MSGVVTVTVSCEGKAINASYPLLSVEVTRQINKISYARLIYSDSDGYAGKFYLTKDKMFEPGKILKINLRYESNAADDKTIFEGVIVRHNIKLDNNASLLILDLKHVAISLTTSRRNHIFIAKSDKEIFSEIIKKYSDIQLDADVSEFKNKQMTQVWCSDWDFILSRSENNGWWLICGSDNQIKIIDPSDTNKLSDSKITLDLSAGSQIYTLDMGIDIIDQVSKISAESWDVDRQQVETENVEIAKGSVFKKLDNSEDYNLYHSGDLNKEELKRWIESKMIKNRFALFRGKIKTSGILNIEPGMVIKLNNLGPYFSGQHVVSSVRHTVDQKGFQTELDIGLPVDSLISLYKVEAPSASAMLPPIKGLHIGVVKGYDEIDDNEKNHLLVKVKLPLFGVNNELWARLSSVYAGDEHGVVFRPEPGDEVILGFFNEDPRYPVILGSMYSAKNKPPIEFDKENHKKSISTKARMQILFDDENKSINLSSSGKNKINITSHDQEKGLIFHDENDNNLILSKQGISCVSKNDIKIDIQKKVTINAEKTVTINAEKMEVK